MLEQDQATHMRRNPVIQCSIKGDRYFQKVWFESKIRILQREEVYELEHYTTADRGLWMALPWKIRV